MHLQLRGKGRDWAPLDFLLGAHIPFITPEAVAHRRAAHLMQQHQDLPMDYADAPLVLFAEALGVDEVFTTDRRGFSAYRGPFGAPFRILPDK